MLPVNYNAYGSIDGCDLILQAIHRKQNELQKIRPKHIVIKDGIEVIDDYSSVAKVLKRPNPYMTTADFMNKIVFLREINQNCYIYPEYVRTKSGKKYFTGLYPLKPREVSYIVDEGGNYFIKMTFLNGYEKTLPANEIIHWRKNFDGDDYFGGNANGNVDLLKSINEYNALCETISRAMECSCKINGVMKINSYLGNEDTEKERIEFEEKLKNNESGILFTDMKVEYTPMPRDVKLVDAETLNFFYDNILRSTGTPKEILSGKYTKETKESWYECCLEGELISLAQAMEKVFFSEREEAFGNRIILYPANIVFMSMENKLEALKIGLPAGLYTRNEAREIIGLPPLTGSVGEEIAQGYNLILNSKEGENE